MTRIFVTGSTDGLGTVMQAWPATATTLEARETHAAVHDEGFQDELLSSLAMYAGCLKP